MNLRSCCILFIDSVESMNLVSDGKNVLWADKAEIVRPLLVGRYVFHKKLYRATDKIWPTVCPFNPYPLSFSTYQP
jgi:hypothetical protein